MVIFWNLSRDYAAVTLLWKNEKAWRDAPWRQSNSRFGFGV